VNVTRYMMSFSRNPIVRRFSILVLEAFLFLFL